MTDLSVLRVKVEDVAGVMRVFSCRDSELNAYATLVGRVVTLFPELSPLQFLSGKDLRLTWRDSDGDEITIYNDASLIDAVRASSSLPRLGAVAVTRTLRVTIRVITCSSAATSTSTSSTTAAAPTTTISGGGGGGGDVMVNTTDPSPVPVSSTNVTNIPPDSGCDARAETTTTATTNNTASIPFEPATSAAGASDTTTTTTTTSTTTTTPTSTSSRGYGDADERAAANGATAATFPPPPAISRVICDLSRAFASSVGSLAANAQHRVRESDAPERLETAAKRAGEAIAALATTAEIELQRAVGSTGTSTAAVENAAQQFVNAFCQAGTGVGTQLLSFANTMAAEVNRHQTRTQPGTTTTTTKTTAAAAAAAAATAPSSPPPPPSAAAAGVPQPETTQHTQTHSQQHAHAHATAQRAHAKAHQNAHQNAHGANDTPHPVAVETITTYSDGSRTTHCSELRDNIWVSVTEETSPTRREITSHPVPPAPGPYATTSTVAARSDVVTANAAASTAREGVIDAALASPFPFAFERELQQLLAMGFSDEPALRALLTRKNGDVGLVVVELTA